jgi:hypothetical protein
MRSSTRFTRSCPTCGRSLDIPVDHIGRQVMCSHCHAEFRATLESEGPNDFEHALEQRIDRLLANSATNLPRPHFDHYSTSSPRTYEV